MSKISPIWAKKYGNFLRFQVHEFPRRVFRKISVWAMKKNVSNAKYLRIIRGVFKPIQMEHLVKIVNCFFLDLSIYFFWERTKQWHGIFINKYEETLRKINIFFKFPLPFLKFTWKYFPNIYTTKWKRLSLRVGQVVLHNHTLNETRQIRHRFSKSPPF